MATYFGLLLSSSLSSSFGFRKPHWLYLTVAAIYKQNNHLSKNACHFYQATRNSIKLMVILSSDKLFYNQLSHDQLSHDQLSDDTLSCGALFKKHCIVKQCFKNYGFKKHGFKKHGLIA